MLVVSLRNDDTATAAEAAGDPWNLLDDGVSRRNSSNKR
jgi:hypothetical protein